MKLDVCIKNKYILPTAGIYSVEMNNGNKTCKGLFKRYSSNPDHNEISFQDMGWMKQRDRIECTI
jgi:hypothetical protein